MDEKQYFKTDDMFFACFLMVKGVELLHLETSEKSTDTYFARCSFVFSLDKDGENIKKYRNEWHTTETGQQMLKLLSYNRLLKKEVRDFLMTLKRDNTGISQKKYIVPPRKIEPIDSDSRLPDLDAIDYEHLTPKKY